MSIKESLAINRQHENEKIREKSFFSKKIMNQIDETMIHLGLIQDGIVNLPMIYIFFMPICFQIQSAL